LSNVFWKMSKVSINNKYKSKFPGKSTTHLLGSKLL
jgi:hypothetical protein